MEKRDRRRYQAQGDITGRVVLVADVDIHDLSLSGMRFACCERVSPQSQIKLVINRKGLQVPIQGDVVRSSLKRRKNPDCKGESFYEVAVRFRKVSGANRDDLEKLIDLMEKDGSSG